MPAKTRIGPEASHGGVKIGPEVVLGRDDGLADVTNTNQIEEVHFFDSNTLSSPEVFF